MTTETEIRRLATVDEFCEFAGITLGHAAQLRYTDDGPEFVKITGRQVRYRWSDIEKWVESRIRRRTDEPAARRPDLVEHTGPVQPRPPSPRVRRRTDDPVQCADDPRGSGAAG
jgi:predicted DNA-binding transcriptional regulator AlpA